MSKGGRGVGIFFAVIIILAVLAYGGWVVWSRLRARRLGLPPPSLNPFKSSGSYSYPAPRPGGIIGWFQDTIHRLKNRRSAAGAYEETSYGRTRGHGPDPDEAWDTRVGTEPDAYGPGGYYEEQELGLHGPSSYSGGSYGAAGAAASGEDRRGRSRTREADDRYDEEMDRRPAHNPFGDSAEQSDISMRGVSPRPMEANNGGHHKKQSSLDDSPTERRSMFRENM